MHLTEDDLILHYYGELAPAVATRAADHLRKIWARLQPELDREPRNRWLSWFAISPSRLAWAAAVVILVGAAFLAGRVSQKAVPANAADTTAASTALRERILLADLGEHLDRSQLMLTELVSAEPADPADVAALRARAAELTADNRLYRQTAAANGNTALAAVLDDLEQVLIDVAASSGKVSASDYQDVRQRIENKGLLLKVRVLSLEVQMRQKAQIRSRASQSS
jgi:hypothetical protein